MKKWYVAAVLILVVGIAAGCGNANKVSSTANTSANESANTTTGQNRGQMMQTPEGKLGRTIMEISRIQRSQNPFTKDQTQKLLTILNDVKAKESIEETYATQKISEINAVYTEQQKQTLTSGQGNLSRNRGNGTQDTNGNPANNGSLGNNGNAGNNGSNGNKNWQQGQRRGNGQSGGFGGNGANGSRNGFDIKSLCDRAITSLQN